MQVSRVRPNSERIILAGRDQIRVVNCSGANIPAGRMEQVLELAWEAHQFARTGTAKPFPDSVFGRCHVAAIYLCHRADRLDGIRGADVVHGIHVPGSGGHAANMERLHHLNLITYPDLLLAVDVTVAQLWKHNAHFKNTAVLVIAAPPNRDELYQLMRATYGGGDWFISPLWF